MGNLRFGLLTMHKNWLGCGAEPGAVAHVRPRQVEAIQKRIRFNHFQK
jgi:hypothetical protein